jgi:hypothetical protein
MKSNLLLLAAAATVAFTSCSQEKTTEVTETTAPASSTETATTTTTLDSTSYRSSADQLASQVATDLRTTDEAAKARLQQIYYRRGRALRDINARPDTAGRYAAVRDLNDMTTREVKAVVTDPAAYRTYTDNQGNYYAGPYSAPVVAASAPAPAAGHRSLGARVGQGSGIKKLENDNNDSKVKYGNGAKIKRNDDGSVKIKRADGTKIKIDEDGHRTVKKGLF